MFRSTCKNANLFQGNCFSNNLYNTGNTGQVETRIIGAQQVNVSLDEEQGIGPRLPELACFVTAPPSMNSL